MTKGKVVGVNGNMVTVEVAGDVSMNEVAYMAWRTGERLNREVIRITAGRAEMQVFEMSRGIGVGDEVEFTAELLSVRLGPGLLGQIYDGLQNPLPELAVRCGFFLKRDVLLEPSKKKRSGPSPRRPGPAIRSRPETPWAPYPKASLATASWCHSRTADRSRSPRSPPAITPSTTRSPSSRITRASAPSRSP